MFQVQPDNAISGIFIKQVLEDSPAGRNGTLKTGDRILEVGSTSCLGFAIILCIMYGL